MATITTTLTAKLRIKKTVSLLGSDVLCDYYDAPGGIAGITGNSDLAVPHYHGDGESFRCYKPGILKSAKFYIKKHGTPNSTAVAKLYTSDATPGYSGHPTGDALATSETFDVTTLTEAYQLISFSFTDRYQLSYNSIYCIVVEYTSGDSDNYIEIGEVDPPDNTFYGNSCFLGSTDEWSGNTSDDVPFFIYCESGNLSAKVDIKNTVTPIEETLIRSYSFSNYSTSAYLSSEESVNVAQSFNYDENVYLSSVSFYLRKYGLPTGNAIAKLYEHTGTFGTSSKPNGTLLSTSNPFDVSLLSTSMNLVNFTFSESERYQLLDGTNYCISIEYSGGDYWNDIAIALDNSSPTSIGNSARANYATPTTWTTSSSDLIYYIYGTSSGSLRAKVNIVNEISKTLTAKINIKDWRTQDKYISAKLRIGSVITLPNYINLTDSFTDTGYHNADRTFYNGGVTKCAQTFRAIGGLIDSIKFLLKREGNPTGTLTAQIFATTGTFGDTTAITGNKPTGSALATSPTLDVSTLSSSAYEWKTFTFSGANRINLTNGAIYAAVITFTNISSDSSNRIRNSISTTLITTAAGVGSYYYAGAWLLPATPEDDYFYVYQEMPGNLIVKLHIKKIVNKTVTAKTYILYARSVVTVTAKTRIKNTVSNGILYQNYHSTYSSYTWMSSAEKIKIAQSFKIGSGGILLSCKFYIQTHGSPTGYAYAKLYAHDGEYGVDSLPTGEPLAVSLPADASKFSPTATLETFSFLFNNHYPLEIATDYVIVLEYSGGDYDNDIKVYHGANDVSSSVGNSAYMEHGTSIWTVDNSRDYVYYIQYYKGLSAKVNIFNAVTQTDTSKVRVKHVNITNTVAAKLKIVYLYNNTITAKVWLRNVISRTLTSKIRLKVLNNTETVTVKVKVVYPKITTISAKAHIKGTIQAGLLFAKLSVINVVERTVDAKVKIVYLITKTVSAKAYLVHLHNTSVSAKLAVKNTKEATVTTKVRAKKTDVTKTVSAKTRIYKKFKLIKYSHFIGSHDNGSILTNSATYYPATAADANPWYYNAEHFNTQTIYFEFDITKLTGVTSATVRLYDITDGAEVIDSALPVTTSGSYRTHALSLTSLHEYIAQVKITAGSGYVRVCRPRIFIFQEDNQITKTESYFPLSCAYTGFSTTGYKSFYPGASPVLPVSVIAGPTKTIGAKVFIKPYSATGHPAKYASAKVRITKSVATRTEESAVSIYQGSGGLFVYHASDWNGVVDFYLEAHFGSTEGRTNYIQLFDITSNTVVIGSEITSTGTATRQRSESFNLEDGKYYSIQTKSSVAGERTSCGEVRLIAYQNTLAEPEKTVTKTLTFYDLRLSTEEITVSDTSYAALSKLDSGSTTDHGFGFDYTLDYESFSFYPRLFVTGRMASDTTGTYSFRIYDTENARYVTDELSTSFPHQAKGFAKDAVDGEVLKDTHQKFVLYGHKEVGDANAVISLYGMYLGVQLKTRNYSADSKVRIVLDEDDFKTALESTIRTITGRLFIKWNGTTWVDESVYLISAKGNSQFSGRKGEIVADQCDFELDNINQRFLRDNSGSDISNYIKPNVEIKFEIGINGYYTRVFTGKIQTVDPNRQSGVVNIACTDNTSVLIDVLAPTTLYTNKRFSEIVEILALNCDIEPQDYSLEESYNIAETVWFENKTTNKVLSELMQAERGRLFFDTSGNLVFWNSRHFTSQQPTVSLSMNEWVKNFHSKVDENDIVNKITVTSEPRKPNGVQVVWAAESTLTADKYSDVLVWVPANSYQNALIELDDPAVEWQTPISGYDFIANSESDGSGTDLTANISVDEFTTYEKQVFLTVTNNGGVDAYLTTFNIRANPLLVYKYIRTIYTDSASIKKYGTKDTTIENNWIATDEMANEIKEAEVNENKEAVNYYDLETIGRPDITTGELIAVETKEDNYTIFQVNQIDWTVDSNGYSQSLELSEKEAVTTTYEESYGIGSGIIGGGVIGFSSRSRAKSNTVTAKVSVKRSLSLTATAQVRIT